MTGGTAWPEMDTYATWLGATRQSIKGVVTDALYEQLTLPLFAWLGGDGHFKLLKQWTDAIPSERLHHEPTILNLCGIVTARHGNPEGALIYFDRAVNLFRKRNEFYGIARVLVDRSIVYRLVSNYDCALRSANEALGLIPPDADCQEVLSTRAMALRSKATTLYYLGHLDGAIRYGTMSLNTFEFLRRHQDVAKVTAEIGMYYSDLGQYNQSLKKYNRALAYWQKNHNPSAMAYLYNSIGGLHNFTGKYVHAVAAFKKAVLYARESKYPRVEAAALVGMGDAYSIFDPKAARTAYFAAEQIAKEIGEKYTHFYALYSASKLARSQGDLFTSQCKLNQAESLLTEEGHDYEAGLCRMEQAKLAQAQNDLESTINDSQQALNLLTGRVVETIQAKVNILKAYRLKGNEQAAVQQLHEIFTIASALDDDHSLVIASRNSKPLLSEAKNDQIIGLRAKQLLAKIEEFEQQLPTLPRLIRQQQIGNSIIPTTPPRLRIETFGHTTINLDDKPINKKDWTRLSRELFFCLLAAPNGLPRSKIGTIFWPEFGPDKVTANLNSNLYKIRKALNNRDIVLFDPATEIYKFNRGECCINRSRGKFQREIEGFVPPIMRKIRGYVKYRRSGSLINEA